MRERDLKTDHDHILPFALREKGLGDEGRRRRFLNHN
jgi:hypothetical protein